VSAGLLLRGGEFVPMPPYDEEIERLLTGRPGGGFSVYAEYRVMWSGEVAQAAAPPHLAASRRRITPRYSA